MNKRSTKMEIQITQEEFNALLRGEISFDLAAIQHDKEEAVDCRMQETRRLPKNKIAIENGKNAPMPG